MWISLCKLFTKEQAKENKVLERVRVGMKEGTDVAKVAKMHTREERTHGRRVVARKEAKGKRKVTKEKTKGLGLAVKQDTLHRGVEREATTSCTPLTKMKLKTLKKLLIMKKSCKRGVRMKKVKDGVVARGDQQTRQTKR